MAILGALNVSRIELVRYPGRTAFLSLAVGATLSSVLLLEGFQTGLLEQLRQVVLGRGADLIAVQAGVTSFLASRSKLPQLSREAVEAVEGVENAEPMTMLPVIFERAGRSTPVVFLVYDRGGGPRRIKAGRYAREPREVVIDESLAAMYDLRPGDEVTISDFTFRVAGVSEGAVAMFTPIVFLSYDDLIDFYFSAGVMGDIASVPLLGYLLIELEAGAAPESVRADLERVVSSIDVYYPETLAEADVEMGRALFGDVLRVQIGVAYVISLMVVGMIIFATASARNRSHGVLMALGFRRRDLLAGLTLESLGITALAMPFAVLIASAVGTAVEAWAPLYAVSVIEPVPLARSAAAAFGLAVLGTFLAAGLVVRLEPAAALRR